jgi:hypothetical protein
MGLLDCFAVVELTENGALKKRDKNYELEDVFNFNT